MCCAIKNEILFKAAFCLCFDELNITKSCQPEPVEGLSKACRRPVEGVFRSEYYKIIG